MPHQVDITLRAIQQEIGLVKLSEFVTKTIINDGLSKLNSFLRFTYLALKGINIF